MLPELAATVACGSIELRFARGWLVGKETWRETPSESRLAIRFAVFPPDHREAGVRGDRGSPRRFLADKLKCCEAC